ncbi:MAG: hypothetical protein KA987_14685, partial [Saprospiraceae bacterium]|nr:hypothetical protein [Saprospiraceae bacterium]
KAPVTKPEGKSDVVVDEAIKKLDSLKTINAGDNKNPINTVSVNDIFKNTYEQGSVEGIFETKQKIDVDKDAVVRGKSNEGTKDIEVSVNDLVPTQAIVDKADVISKIKGEKGNFEQSDKPLVFEKDGKYYIVDGHNRIAADILKGKDKIQVREVEQSLSKQESGGKAPVTKSEGAKVVMPGENVKPNIVELKKEEKYGKYETLARKAAENIMKAELPSWAKADLPDGTKLSGTNFDQIKKLIADATIKLGKLMDTGSEYAEAIKEAVKELVDYLGENRREDIEKGVTDAYLENGGELPKLKARITADQAEKLDAQSKKEKSQSDAYEAAGEFEFGRMPFEPTDNPIINHKLKTNGVQQAFGTELTQQELWNDMPSEEKYDVQIKMLDDGNEMIGLAKMMFGGTDINVYGPELFRFIQNMPDTPDNKKVILTASFIGELRNELDRSKSGSIRPLYNAVNLYYRNYMHVTAKRLAAGRILRLFTDKYMAGIFGDVILEADQVKEKKDIENAIADTDITDQDAASFQEAKSKGKTKEQAKKESDVDKKNNESKRSESAKRKAANKKNYEDLAKKKEADIKAKYGDKKSLLNDIIKKINDLNCP